MSPSRTKSRANAGTLIVIEGPDGVGKTTLADLLAAQLRQLGQRVESFSFPGRAPGTLGRLVYDLHHNPEALGVEAPSALSLQVLHIAAHVDAIARQIRPHLSSGVTVILDRYWWSTWVYGSVAGVDLAALESVVALENTVWKDCKPTAIFLLSRSHPLRPELSPESWRRLSAAYAELAQRVESDSPVVRLPNEGTIAATLEATLRFLRDGQGADIRDEKIEAHDRRVVAPQSALPFGEPRPIKRCTSIGTQGRWLPATPTKVFDTYWRFAAERHRVFLRRCRGEAPPWTSDPILQRHKFTNAYRAADRTSQYLLKKVIYKGDQSPAEVFFRTLLFKFFNRVETWELLQRELGEVRWATFALERYDKVLCRSMARGDKIYSAAYIMPAAERVSGVRKHVTHLRLLERMMEEGLPDRLLRARSMKEAFESLRVYPMMGNFLAYQYVTDLNYSSHLAFSEMEFVVPGPGARDGIRKCFDSLGGASEADIIRLVAERQSDEFEARGIEFQGLWGRPLQLIDCQNLFCEVDKYARLFHPDVAGISGRVRIKQMFRYSGVVDEPWFPPMWGINERVVDDLRGGANGADRR